MSGDVPLLSDAWVRKYARLRGGKIKLSVAPDRLESCCVLCNFGLPCSAVVYFPLCVAFPSVR